MANKNMGAYLKYILALLMFGSNGIVASFISLNSCEIVFLRTLIGSLMLFILFFIGKNKFTFYKNKKKFIYLAISGIAMGASWMFLYEAYQQIGVSIASLAYYCGPVIVMAISPLIFGERFTIIKIFGFTAVLAGIFLVNCAEISKSYNYTGLFYGGMSAVMYAFMVIFNKKASDIKGLENSALQLFISFLTVALFVGIKQQFIINISSEEIIPILILGLINTGIGCYFYFSSIGYLPVQTVAVLGYLEPLSAVLFSTLFLGEKMLFLQIIGAVLIICGAITAELNNSNKAKNNAMQQN